MMARQVLVALALLVGASAFATPGRSVRKTSALHAEDPTKVWYAELANGIQNVLTNSPLNEGKKAMVKAMAGDYDVEATRAKLQGLVDDSPVLMLSFTT